MGSAITDDLLLTADRLRARLAPIDIGKFVFDNTSAAYSDSVAETAMHISLVIKVIATHVARKPTEARRALAANQRPKINGRKLSKIIGLHKLITHSAVG